MLKLSKSQQQFVKELSLDYQSYGFIHAFEKEGSSLLFCDVENKYTLIYGDYYIPHDFELSFTTTEKFFRFGLVHNGTSEFKMKNKNISHFFPSPFMAIENKLTGKQNLKRGHHYKSIEFFIHTEYIDQLKHHYSELQALNKLPDNHAILFLPTKILHIFNYLECQITKKELSPMMLEAKVMECLSLIASELDKTEFIDSLQLKSLKVSLTTHDIYAIQKIHDILINELENPPSVKQLTEKFLISEQKLSLGFKEIYHSTIGQFIKDQRLHEAANLLTTTELSIDEISSKVGYSHPSNLGKAFKTKYLRTPLQYRKFNTKK